MSAIPASATTDATADPGTARPSVLPDQDREEFARLHASVTSDWGPRDAYERRWVMELVTSMWRQDRLRGLELAALGAATAESPPTEATVRKLATFARYGARIDKDIGRALQALRVLRDGSRIVRTAKLKTPKSYLAKAALPDRLATLAPIPERELGFEFMMNALRLVEGVGAEMFVQRTGLDR